VVLWSPHGFENEIKVDLIKKIGGKWDPRTVIEAIYDYTVLSVYVARGKRNLHYNKQHWTETKNKK
jgi:hypothetical protein